MDKPLVQSWNVSVYIAFDEDTPRSKVLVLFFISVFFSLAAISVVMIVQPPYVVHFLLNLLAH